MTKKIRKDDMVFTGEFATISSTLIFFAIVLYFTPQEIQFYAQTYAKTHFENKKGYEIT
jgi:hypothetical protein